MNTGDGPKYNSDQFPIDGCVSEEGFEFLKNNESLLREVLSDNPAAVAQGCVSEEAFEFFKKNESLLGEVLHDNPAAVAQGETVNEEMTNEQSNVVEGIPAPLAGTVLGGSRSAAQTVRRGRPARRKRPAPTGVEIKVVTRRSQTDKPTQYTFDVDPDEEVASLRVLLANKRADVPPFYQFYHNMGVMNERYSFRAHKIDGVGVRVQKIEVIDVTANFPTYPNLSFG